MNTVFINQLVTDGWTLEVWEARYGGHIWAMVGPEHYVDQLRDITGGGDIEAVELEMYLRNLGSCIPAAVGNNVTEALHNLNEKIGFQCQSDGWQDAVSPVYLRMIQVSDGHYGLSLAIEDPNEKVFLNPNHVK